MRSAVTELSHLLFCLPAYLCLLLAFGAVTAFRQQRRLRWAWAVALALAYTASAPVSSNALVNWLEQRYPAPSQARLKDLPAPQILVLSGGWFRARDGGGYEVMLATQDWARINTAVSLWKATGGTLIFSGAPVPDGTDSVAQRMAEVAQAWGVPASALRTETRSTNTYENLVFSRDQFGLQGQGPILLVTSALHMPRSMAVAHKLGLAVLPVPCDYRGDTHTQWRHWLPSNDGAQALEQVLHEMAGLLAYQWKGQA